MKNRTNRRTLLVVLWSATGAAGLGALVQLAEADYILWAVLALTALAAAVCARHLGTSPSRD